MIEGWILNPLDEPRLPRPLKPSGNQYRGDAKNYERDCVTLGTDRPCAGNMTLDKWDMLDIDDVEDASEGRSTMG